MAGTMRKLGIYLGLAEEDDPRGYRRYDDADADPAARDRFGDRYEGRYDARHDAPGATASANRVVDDPYPIDPRTASADTSAVRYGGTYAGDPYAADPYAVDPRTTADRLEGRFDPGPAAAAQAARPGRPLGLAPQAAASSSGSASAPAGSSATAAAVAVQEPEPAPAPQPYRITTLHPRTYNEARRIGEDFRDGKPVIMNLSDMSDADAKRLVDFAAGLSFGLRGSIERVTARVFLLSPQDVDVTAEDRERIREGGFTDGS
jgi:cell division inhibitor SepF